MRVSFYTAGVLAVHFARQLNAVSVQFENYYQNTDPPIATMSRPIPATAISAAQTSSRLESEVEFGFKKSFNKLKKFGTNTFNSLFNKSRRGARNLGRKGQAARKMALKKLKLAKDKKRANFGIKLSKR